MPLGGIGGFFKMLGIWIGSGQIETDYDRGIRCIDYVASHGDSDALKDFATRISSNAEQHCFEDTNANVVFAKEVGHVFNNQGSSYDDGILKGSEYAVRRLKNVLGDNPAASTLAAPAPAPAPASAPASAPPPPPTMEDGGKQHSP